MLLRRLSDFAIDCVIDDRGVIDKFDREWWLQ